MIFLLLLLQDLAIQQYHLSRVLILDLDAEQGDGTASLFQKNNFVTTISVHSKKSNNLDSKTFHSKVDIECDVRIFLFLFLFLFFSLFL